MHQEYTDQEIQELLREDGEKAVEWLFRRHYRYLCKVVYKVLPDANLVEDLVQEVFFEVWRKRENIRITTSLKAYLRRAAVNKTLNFIRDQKIKPDDEERLPPLESKIVNINQQLDAEDLQKLIDQSIDQLPERCRLVFVLSRFEDMSYQEIADKLGISIKTVENQVSKALRYLRISLGPYISVLILFWTSLF